MSDISSYSRIRNLGHPEIVELLDGPVLVEEKVDGSQFSFRRDSDGTFHARSKGKDLYAATDEKMFSLAYANAAELDLTPNWTYRCEYLQKPKHNTLAYDRVPAFNLIVFDIDAAYQSYLGAAPKAAEAERIGLEVVPVLLSGGLHDIGQFERLLETPSILGGQTVEGVVIKNYAKFYPDGKTLMGKHVSEKFKEINKKDFRDRNPSQGDILSRVGQSLRTEARWQKAVQHLAERGELAGAPQDIGKLMKEVPADVLEECREEIVEALMKWAWPSIRRQVVAGLPEWYKDTLAAQQFEPVTR